MNNNNNNTSTTTTNTNTTTTTNDDLFAPCPWDAVEERIIQGKDGIPIKIKISCLDFYGEEGEDDDIDYTHWVGD
jgi:hypothetical protein